MKVKENLYQFISLGKWESRDGVGREPTKSDENERTLFLNEKKIGSTHQKIIKRDHYKKQVKKLSFTFL